MMVSAMVDFNPAAFLVEVRGELEKVTWPTRKETLKLTAIVVGVSLAVALYVGGLDFLFTRLLGLIV
jgi:preprotein translocase subunit SecE